MNYVMIRVPFCIQSSSVYVQQIVITASVPLREAFIRYLPLYLKMEKSLPLLALMEIKILSLDFIWTVNKLII